MKLCSKILAIAILAFTTYAMVGCAAPNGYSYQNISVTLTHFCADCGDGVFTSPTTTPVVGGAETTLLTNTTAGGCAVFTATVTNAPPIVTWALYPNVNVTQTGTNIGVISTTSGSFTEGSPIVGTLYDSTGLSTYWCQNGIPSYSGQALVQANALQIPQGDVLLTASVPADPSNSSLVFTKNEMLQIYNVPSTGNPLPIPYLVPASPTTVNTTATVANVVHNGGSFQIQGYAVGDRPCTPVGTTAYCATNTDLNLSDAPAYTTDNSVLWDIGFNPVTLNGGVLSDITNACTFTSYPTSDQLKAANALTTTGTECKDEGWIVLGSIVNGTQSATYYAPATTPTNVAVSGTAGSGVPVIVLYANGDLTAVTSKAYINVY